MRAFVSSVNHQQPGDPKAGQAKAGACAACHGVDGNAAAALYPKLAGQHEQYIWRQLKMYKSGERNNAIMLGMAAALTEQDMRDIGAFFATQKASAGIADDTVVADGPYKGLKFYEIGQQLYRGGDVARGLPACMACHGPTGAGNPGPAYPHIGGQHASYVARRLQEYQAGQTNETDKAHFQIMATVAQKLTEQEVQALSSYLQGLHNKADDLAAAGASTRPAAAP